MKLKKEKKGLINGKPSMLFLDEKTREKAKKIGKGSMSAGVRIAVEKLKLTWELK